MCFAFEYYGGIFRWESQYSRMGGGVVHAGNGDQFRNIPGISRFRVQYELEQVVPGLMIVFAVILAVYVFVPYFRRANLVSAYEYLGIVSILGTGLWLRGLVIVSVLSYGIDSLACWRCRYG